MNFHSLFFCTNFCFESFRALELWFLYKEFYKNDLNVIIYIIDYMQNKFCGHQNVG